MERTTKRPPTVLELWIPSLPPSANRLYRSFGYKVYKTKEAVAYQREAAGCIHNQLPQVLPVDTAWQLRIEFIFHPKRLFTIGKTAKSRFKKLDLDNRAKILIDAWRDATGIDDNAIFDLQLSKKLGDKEGVKIVMKEMLDVVEQYRAFRANRESLEDTSKKRPSRRKADGDIFDW